MKKILLSFIIFTSCNQRVEESGHTEELLKRADSVLVEHYNTNEETLKVLEQVIEKYTTDTTDTTKK